MLYVTGYAKIYDLDRQENFIRCNLSTSKRNRKGEYEYMHWRGRIVGEGVLKTEGLRPGDSVKLEHAIAETYYVKDKKKAFTSIVIFDLTPLHPKDPS
ncbi:hypothetical protein J0B03_07955 [Alkalibacter rhizosphaerae]|uniref:Uncharacterized protein n=1 Tax=Alkalibacter rhizosphaerae TaxID=2815577 RepID=A0A974XDD3_9FIRM|nr:hypothetical protein [Alkalibacter rhizosphaerae]QSX07754.1 hypothetical protein J0B03_07955 [Alkalibacter rhizosphaerae]